MRNYFVFDQYDSRDFGVYISGTGTFASPTREYENIVVPGRNGDLLGLEHRLENVTLTYPAFMYADFKNGMTALRSALLSVIGYAKLYDTYHPDEYRLAVYKGGLEPDVVDGNYAGQFDLTFECLPQRFLVDGDTVKVIGQWGPTETAAGEVVTLNNDGKMGFKSVAVTLTPKQSGTGDPSPSNVRPISGYNTVEVTRAGKNLFDISKVLTNVGRVTNNGDGTLTIQTGSSSSSTVAIAPCFLKSYADLKVGETYTLSGTSTGTNKFIYLSGANLRWDFGTSKTITQAMLDSIVNWYASGVNSSATVSELQIELGTVASTYEPYTADTYPITLPSSAGTVYGGNLDVATGGLVVDRRMVDGGTLTWTYWTNNMFFAVNSDQYATEPMQIKASNYPSINYNASATLGIFSVMTNSNTRKNVYIADTSYSHDATGASQLKNAMTGQQIVYPIEPVTYTLDPVTIKTLLGQNAIWSDGTSVTVEYGEDAYTVDNPTLFDALPLIRVYGYGELGFGDYTITVAQSNLPYIDIDCDLMECYCENINANSYVSFSSVDFPVLPPGVSGIAYPSTITKVEITPRTWRV